MERILATIAIYLIGIATGFAVKIGIDYFSKTRIK